jgi:hypothetical protein
MPFPTNEKKEPDKIIVRSRGNLSVTGWQQNHDSIRMNTSGHFDESGDSADPKGKFLSDIMQWREQLARAIARNNYALRSAEIATAVNQIIFLLLFMRIAEDRGLIETGTLEKIRETDDPFASIRKAAQKIDDSWKDPGSGDTNNAIPDAYPDIDNPVLITILSRLCSAERPYNFATMPTVVIAQVFDQYLARTVRRSATHQVTIVNTHTTISSGVVPGPARQAIGYLVQSTLDAALASRSDKEILPLRILDPACGAGVILLRAFDHLIDVTGPANILFAEKKEILLNSIHGVDIDRQSVAAAKILLVIKLMEDERAESLPGNFFMVCKEVFRGLMHTIQTGNALIGPEIMNEELWSFFPSHKRQSINLFEWKTRFPEICASGGFDVIMGFPPRGPLESHELIQHYFQRHYAVYHPLAERSGYFIERGLSLLRRGGKLGIIMNDPWLRGKAGSSLRSAVRMSRIEEIVLSGENRGTKKNPALCIIRLAKCTPLPTFFVAFVSPAFKGKPADFNRLNRFTVHSATLDDGGWIFHDRRIQDIITKTRKSGTILEEFVMGQVFEGIETGPDTLIIDKKMKEHLVRDHPACETLIRPCLSGKRIARYQIPRNMKYLVFIPGERATGNAKTASYLFRCLKKQYTSLVSSQRPSMKGTEVSGGEGDTHGWKVRDREFCCGTDPKIFFPNRFKHPAFAYDEGMAIPDQATGVIASSSLYLLGLLNSRLMEFLFNNFIQISGSVQRMHSWQELRNLPVYTIDFDNPDDKIRHNRMVTLVTEMLQLHKHMSQAKTDQEKRLITREIESTDKQIDSLVYGLYGLTADEIELIETSTTS